MCPLSKYICVLHRSECELNFDMGYMEDMQCSDKILKPISSLLDSSRNDAVLNTTVVGYFKMFHLHSCCVIKLLKHLL